MIITLHNTFWLNCLKQHKTLAHAHFHSQTFAGKRTEVSNCFKVGLLLFFTHWGGRLIQYGWIPSTMLSHRVCHVLYLNEQNKAVEIRSRRKEKEKATIMVIMIVMMVMMIIMIIMKMIMMVVILKGTILEFVESTSCTMNCLSNMHAHVTTIQAWVNHVENSARHWWFKPLADKGGKKSGVPRKPLNDRFQKVSHTEATINPTQHYDHNNHHIHYLFAQVLEAMQSRGSYFGFFFFLQC